MSTRPVFIPIDRSPYVGTQVIEFQWVCGLSKSQRRKNIVNLHHAAKSEGIRKILEISTASEDELGSALSAFNLQVTVNIGSEKSPKMQTNSVEAIYQSSKKGANGGPHPEWLTKTGKEIKKLVHQADLGKISLYQYGQNFWPAEPVESFFTWLYIQGLMQREGTIEQLAEYDGFTDIYFNPKKTINCQARAAAQAVSMYRMGRLDEIMSSRKTYLEFAKKNPSGHIGKSGK